MIEKLQYGDAKGSLRDIRILINERQDLINDLIKKKFKELVHETICWKSPLRDKDFKEYQDLDFLNKLGLDNKLIQLEKFWPKKGPVWDALARTSSGHIILVEAKANIPELVTPATGAGKKSKEVIDDALNKTKSDLGIINNIDWSGKFYQYTNRLAHLNYLTEKYEKTTYLINIYFIGDRDVSGPNTREEWDGALKVLYSYLGLGRHKLSKYMANIFIDVNHLIK